jgi:hypothetical protein
MRELQYFLNYTLASKRTLKEIYYTARDDDLKTDARQLVTAIIGIQKTLEELLEVHTKSKLGAKLLGDRKAGLELRKWSVGLDRRVKDYAIRTRKLRQEHAHRYQVMLLQYMDQIGQELAGWIIDIQTLRETPRPPK